MDIVIERNAVNLEALDTDLRAALGNAVAGVSFGAGVVTVHLTSLALPNDAQTAQQIVLIHDSNKLSATQQAAAAQLVKLNAARQAQQGDLQPGNFIDPLLNQLAQKIAWLEQEIIALRAGR